MTRMRLPARIAAALFSSALIFALTVDILDEIPSGEQPPAAVERAPITSPQLDGPYFQQAEVKAEAQTEVKTEAKAEAKTEATPAVMSAAVAAPQVPAMQAPAPAEAVSASPQMPN